MRRIPVTDTPRLERQTVQLQCAARGPICLFRQPLVRERAEPENLLDEDPIEQYEEAAHTQDDGHAEYADRVVLRTTRLLLLAVLEQQWVRGSVDLVDRAEVGSDLEVFWGSEFVDAALKHGEGEVVQVFGFEYPLVFWEGGRCGGLACEDPVLREEEIGCHDFAGPLDRHAPCCLPHDDLGCVLAWREREIAFVDGVSDAVETCEVGAFVACDVAELVLFGAAEDAEVVGCDGELWATG